MSVAVFKILPWELISFERVEYESFDVNYHVGLPIRILELAHLDCRDFHSLQKWFMELHTCWVLRIWWEITKIWKWNGLCLDWFLFWVIFFIRSLSDLLPCFSFSCLFHIVFKNLFELLCFSFFCLHNFMWCLVVSIYMISH